MYFFINLLHQQLDNKSKNLHDGIKVNFSKNELQCAIFIAVSLV